jgi:hypothetical protein
MKKLVGLITTLLVGSIIINFILYRTTKNTYEVVGVSAYSSVTKLSALINEDSVPLDIKDMLVGHVYSELMSLEQLDNGLFTIRAEEVELICSELRTNEISNYIKSDSMRVGFRSYLSRLCDS